MNLIYDHLSKKEQEQNTSETADFFLLNKMLKKPLDS